MRRLGTVVGLAVSGLRSFTRAVTPPSNHCPQSTPHDAGTPVTGGRRPIRIFCSGYWWPPAGWRSSSDRAASSPTTTTGDP